MNLLVNAVKFSAGSSAIVMSSETYSDHFVVKVKDAGIGIPKEDLVHLFERFYRGSNAVNIQGTGLGLHIVARYIELLEGAIQCESELGKGTLFTVMVPMTANDHAANGN
jgi:signal transduction histidine kinase